MRGGQKCSRIEVLKREVLEGEKAGSARKQVARAAGRMLRTQKQEAPNEALPRRQRTSLVRAAAS